MHTLKDRLDRVAEQFNETHIQIGIVTQQISGLETKKGELNQASLILEGKIILLRELMDAEKEQAAIDQAAAEIQEASLRAEQEQKQIDIDREALRQKLIRDDKLARVDLADSDSADPPAHSIATIKFEES